MTWTPDVVIYHDHCADGFGAAWACWMRWRDACEYLPASYGQEPPDVAGKHVLIVDFSYKKPVLEQLGAVAKSIVILDHHKTAEEDLFEFTEFLAEGPETIGLDLMATEDCGTLPIVAKFDMNRSGARMAWEFCHPGTEPPLLIRLIEDRDLWRFTMADTKPFALWLRAWPFGFERFEHVARELEDARDRRIIMLEARAMQIFFDANVEEIAAFARRRRIGDHEPIVVNCPPMFASDVGHALLDQNPDAPFAATYFDGPSSRMWSLRSRDDRVDVSAIAARFGGGGHRNAAGFSAAAMNGDLITRLEAAVADDSHGPIPDDAIVEVDNAGLIREAIAALKGRAA